MSYSFPRKAKASYSEIRVSQTMVSTATAHLLLTLLAGLIQRYGAILPPSVAECIYGIYGS